MIKINNKDFVSSICLSFLFVSSYLFKFINYPFFYYDFYLSISNFIIALFFYAILIFFYLKYFINIQNWLFNFIKFIFFFILIFCFLRSVILLSGYISISEAFIDTGIGFNFRSKILFFSVVSSLTFLAYVFKFNLIKFLKIYSTIIFIVIFYYSIQNDRFVFNLNDSFEDAIENKNIDKKVIVIIFDAFDSEIFEELYNNDNNSFNRAKSKAVSFNNAYAPGRDTIYSMPHFLIGDDGRSDVFFDRKNLYLKNENIFKKFNYENSFFNNVKPENSFLVAGVNIYCANFDFKNCYDGKHDIKHQRKNYELIDYLNGFDFIISIYNNILRSYMFDNEALKTNKEVLKIIEKENIKKLIFQKNKYDRIFKHSLNGLLNPNYELILLHFPYPHSPFVLGNHLYSKKRNINELSIIDGYVNNLKLSEEIFSKLNSQIEKLQNINELMIIITSDHGFRYKEEYKGEARKVPFIIKLTSDNNALTSNRNISTFNTKILIDAFFDNKIKNHQDIVNFFNKTKFVKPIIKKRKIN